MMFHYTVKYWDEIEQDTQMEEGFIAAKDHGSAVNRLVEYYGGRDKIDTIEIYESDDILPYSDIKYL